MVFLFGWFVFYLGDMMTDREAIKLALEALEFFNNNASNPAEKFITSKALELGEDIVVETDLAKIVITSSGARIKSCQLKKYPEESIKAEAIQE